MPFDQTQFPGVMSGMTAYGLITYGEDGRNIGGILVDGLVHPLSSMSDATAVLDALGCWTDFQGACAAFLSGPRSGGVPLPSVRLCAPIPCPPTIYCAGANYADHVRAMEAKLGLPASPNPRDAGLKPWHFLKSGHCVVGPDATVSTSSEYLDWEAELAAVIGTAGRNIPVEDALDHVAGYMPANDLSARDRMSRKGVNSATPFFYDWVGHKSFEGACPMGPVLIPASRIADPQDLRIELSVNGQVKQNSTTKEMIFSVAEQISFMSTIITLHPGDVILTGTPAGTGAEAGESLHLNDEIRIVVEKLGTLVTWIA